MSSVVSSCFFVHDVLQRKKSRGDISGDPLASELSLIYLLQTVLQPLRYNFSMMNGILILKVQSLIRAMSKSKRCNKFLFAVTFEISLTERDQ